MSKRLFLTVALAVSCAFGLTIATPAWACGKDCDCAKKSSAEKPDKKNDTKPAEKPAADGKKADLAAPAAVKVAAGEGKKCECEKGGKGCTCPKGECKCANCGHTAKRV